MNTHEPPTESTSARRGFVLVVTGAALAALGAWLLLRPPPAANVTPGGATRPEQVGQPRADRTAEAARPNGSSRPPTSGTPASAAARPAEPPAVAGVVVDETDRPVAGAEIHLVEVEAAALRGVPAGDGARLAETTSGPDGTFRLAAPAVPLARVSAAVPGRATAA